MQRMRFGISRKCIINYFKYCAGISGDLFSHNFLDKTTDISIEDSMGTNKIYHEWLSLVIFITPVWHGVAHYWMVIYIHAVCDNHDYVSFLISMRQIVLKEESIILIPTPVALVETIAKNICLRVMRSMANWSIVSDNRKYYLAKVSRDLVFQVIKRGWFVNFR